MAKELTEIISNVEMLQGKKILQYPIGLGTTALDGYGQEEQYVLFKVQTDEKTTKLRDDKDLGGVVVTGSHTGVGVESSPFVGLNKNKDPDANLRFGKENVDKERWFVRKGMRRLDRVIVLPMPNEHRVSTHIKYNEDYNPTQLTKLGDFLNQNGNSGAYQGILKNVKNSAITTLVNSMKSGATDKRAMLAEESLADNPRKEVMFDSFGFRKFNFNYTFAPKDPYEAKMVQDIVETFRYYSLPEVYGGRLFYVFPSEWEILFMKGDKENPHIPRITTSVCTGVNINYTPHNLWGTLPDGEPLSMTVSLEFLELELVDRSRVYNPNSTITSGY